MKKIVIIMWVQMLVSDTAQINSDWRTANTLSYTIRPEDLNNDGVVDIFDYNLLVTNFGKTGSPGFDPADINRDGKVDLSDYDELVPQIGK